MSLMTPGIDKLGKASI